ncbi:MAG TPA: GNAT family N-acetyltransferase [Longimicrobium sp.]|nr:GNAT family N-acetyltransferase [Longimicrobium sp.]
MTAGADGIVLRDARAEDLDAVRALTLRAYAEYARVMAPSAWAGLEEAVRRTVESKSDAERIVVEHEGRIVGSVMLFPAETATYGGSVEAPPWPELRLLAVSPDARGMGVGRLLVDECVRRARASGARELGLHTSKSMETAIGMYRRMGFVRAPEHDFQPEGAELVEGYRLRLDGR